MCPAHNARPCSLSLCISLGVTVEYVVRQSVRLCPISSVVGYEEIRRQQSKRLIVSFRNIFQNICTSTSTVFHYRASFIWDVISIRNISVGRGCRCRTLIYIWEVDPAYQTPSWYPSEISSPPEIFTVSPSEIWASTWDMDLSGVLNTPDTYPR